MLQSVFTALDAFSHALNRHITRMVGIITLLMFGSLITQVLCRYFFNSPLSWPEEFTMFLMAWMSFLGASVALRRWSHIGVDLFINMLRGKARTLFFLLVRLLVFAFALFLLIEGASYVMSSRDMLSDGMRISMVYPRLSMPVGGLLMTIHILAMILGDLCALAQPED